MKIELFLISLFLSNNSILSILYLSHLGKLILIISLSFHPYSFATDIILFEGGNNILLFLFIP